MAASTLPYALAVDDDPIILMDISGILEDAGFRTYEADDGDAAIAMLPAHAENIILLFSDVEMPGGTNGFALARHVAKNWPHNRHRQWPYHAGAGRYAGEGHVHQQTVHDADDSRPPPQDPARWEKTRAVEAFRLTRAVR